MMLNKKKIIAKEFLILICCFIVFGLALILTFPYNFLIESKIEKLKNSKQILSAKMDSTTETIIQKEEKQEQFYLESKQKVDYGNKTTATQVWDRWAQIQEADSIIYLWNNKWDTDIKMIFKELGFNNAKEVNQFIAKYSFTSHEKNHKPKSDSIKNELNEIRDKISIQKNKTLNFEEKINFSLFCFIAIGIVAFPIRYLFYSIKWSIKILKQKD